MDILLEKGLLPDIVVRQGIRQLLKQRLKDEYQKQDNNIVKELTESPIAMETDKANDQHYMVPPQFFLNCLGPHLKYSCCLWDNAKDLGEAEEEMLYTPWPMQYAPEDWLGSIGSGKPTLFAAASSAASSSSSLSSSSSRRSRSRSSQKQGNTIMKVALKHNIPPTNVIKYGEAADGAPYNDKETSPAAPTTRLRLL